MSATHVVTVIAVLSCKNKFLLVKRALSESIYPGKWQNLGGKVEEEEIIEEALKREIQEEIGLTIFERPIYLQSYSWRMIKDEPNRLGLIFLFPLKGRQTDYRVTLNKELSEFGWFSLEEVANLETIGEKTARAGTYGQIEEALKHLPLPQK
jgi:8-oxo-dGTP diphosphatase